MKLRSIAPMRIAKWGYLFFSLVSIAAGLCFLLKPELSVVGISRWIGLTLMFFGAVKLVGYYSRDLFRLAFQYDREFGILMVILGLVLFIRPFESLSVLLPVFGISTISDALFKLRIAEDARRFGIRPWWLLFALGVVNIVFGALMVIRPWESAELLTRLFGIGMISGGCLNFCTAVSTVKIIRHQLSEKAEPQEEWF